MLLLRNALVILLLIVGVVLIALGLIAIYGYIFTDKIETSTFIASFFWIGVGVLACIVFKDLGVERED